MPDEQKDGETTPETEAPTEQAEETTETPAEKVEETEVGTPE